METYPGEIQKHDILNFPKNTNLWENSYDKLVGFWGVHDDVTETQHLVKFAKLVDTTVQNNIQSWLLNFILDSSGTDTLINV